MSYRNKGTDASASFSISPVAYSQAVVEEDASLPRLVCKSANWAQFYITTYHTLRSRRRRRRERLALAASFASQWLEINRVVDTSFGYLRARCAFDFSLLIVATLSRSVSPVHEVAFTERVNRRLARFLQDAY